MARLFPTLNPHLPTLSYSLSLSLPTFQTIPEERETCTALSSIMLDAFQTDCLSWERQRKVRIDIYAEPNRVTFRSSHLDLSKDQFRYKLSISIQAFRLSSLHFIHQQLDFLACDYDTKSSNWEDSKGNRLRMKIRARPYTNVTFQIREKTTGKIIATNSTVTPVTDRLIRTPSFLLRLFLALRNIAPHLHENAVSLLPRPPYPGPSPTTNHRAKSYWNPRTRGRDRRKTTLRFTWNGLRSNNDNPGYYTLTFLDGDKSTVKNVTDTEIKFAHLTPGKKYTLEVKECFTTVHCDILTTLEEWTEPEKPRVLEKTELQTTTRHHHHHPAACPAEPSRIEVVEDKDPEELVVVGGDCNGGKGLESDTEYIVFIVTETRAGPYSEYFSCKPRIMRTANRPKEPAT
ncbi:hypothetical protein O3P69_010121 [Scylla paramamosain]|uniref:Fibronectin type-III domain-containing protein n=1 Tax=Scylla paramamosain TaxID=85552 RepID=A0AAW0S977_SCYPA